MPLTIRAALLAALLAGACGGDEEPPVSEPDAAAGVEPTCLTSDEGGASMPLRIGDVQDTEFVDMTDGQQVELVWGGQGLLMVIFDVAVESDMGGDTVCFQCETSLRSPTAAFPDARLDYMFHFARTSDDLYSTQTILVLSSLAKAYEGATAVLTARCDGHARSGIVERTIDLTVPPPPPPP